MTDLSPLHELVMILIQSGPPIPLADTERGVAAIISTDHTAALLGHPASAELPTGWRTNSTSLWARRASSVPWLAVATTDDSAILINHLETDWRQLPEAVRRTLDHQLYAHGEPRPRGRRPTHRITIDDDGMHISGPVLRRTFRDADPLTLGSVADDDDPLSPRLRHVLTSLRKLEQANIRELALAVFGSDEKRARDNARASIKRIRDAGYPIDLDDAGLYSIGA